MTSSPTVSSRKWTDSVTPENFGPMGMTNAPDSWTMRRGRQSASGRRLRIAACGIKSAAHRLDAFLPSVVVEHEIAQMRMTFEAHAVQILRFPLVPVRRVNPFDDAGKDILSKGRVRQHVHPAACACAVKRVAQLPLVSPSSTIRPAKLKSHSSTIRRHISASTARVQLTSLVDVEVSKPYCACPSQRRSICPSVRCGSWAVHRHYRGGGESTADHAAVWECRRRAPAPAPRPESAPAGS